MIYVSLITMHYKNNIAHKRNMRNNPLASLVTLPISGCHSERFQA